MLEHLAPWSPTTEVTTKVKIDDLEIRFKRTIRVPDNDDTNDLPPDAGSFPLYKVDDYADALPLSMAQKGGLFIPMYQKEAIWVGFTSMRRYAIEVFVGGINAVSGEPIVADAATALRRRNLIRQGKSVQDYVVVPGQHWLDGIAFGQGNVRQFVAMPAGKGHSVESQITGEEVTGGIQFNISRLDIMPRDIKKEDEITLMVQSLNRGYISLKASQADTVAEFKARFEAKEKVPADLLHHETLAEYHLPNHGLIQTATRLRGGAVGNSAEMHMAAGGRITQGIVALQKLRYSKTVPVTFNVQVLNSASFERVTGKKPPQSPITAKWYADAGYPFFSIYEEPTTICGDFTGVKSIAEIDGTTEESMPVGMPVVDCITRKVRPGKGAVGLFNPQALDLKLELEWELVERLQKMRTLF
ncbi:hypothetical protein FGSG_08156 [Fusarium graminearum PH-1]|uniref:Chromosome 2, complete genome n=1 Tax=Gibberella zeae (strain ATCC MYA-4620 / CBS 123657 / FGSC 9075 / NRRL 31084 / PH-1) TaxID=229533 RepID=I1RV91_GIBZE|nr:hypothetical protein FGSG_08156 [Fusarium graminearum PH-1]ESU15232.1 hypothetical protein FGSG_08156 [Fusarium graminearum PH-1]EYB25198.1 hypothetical protein FG05_08156 [Fusarium graminearum]CEF76426.1 unnamed protein product [Fusarium graminearum]|eukprot:XP_011320657.1 hypothetical protein FGSG_08156 [Fusarium graminearum PH-1]